MWTLDSQSCTIDRTVKYAVTFHPLYSSGWEFPSAAEILNAHVLPDYIIQMDNSTESIDIYINEQSFDTFEDALKCVRDFEEMTQSRFVTIKRRKPCTLELLCKFWPVSTVSRGVLKTPHRTIECHRIPRPLCYFEVPPNRVGVMCAQLH